MPPTAKCGATLTKPHPPPPHITGFQDGWGAGRARRGGASECAMCQGGAVAAAPPHTTPPPVPSHVAQIVRSASLSPRKPRRHTSHCKGPPELPARAGRANTAATTVVPGSWAAHAAGWVGTLTGFLLATTDSSAAGKGTKQSLDAAQNSTAVQWVADEDRDSCQQCNRTFWLFVRRHHCRSCGDVFCYSCSSQSVQLGSTSQRVCDKCYDQLKGN